MRELLAQATLVGMMICAGLSLWPFRFVRRWRSWNLYLPFAGMVLYGIHELALPDVVQIGWRMAAIVPLLLFLWVNGMVKVALLATLQEKAGGSRRRLMGQPQRRFQVLLGVPILAACLVWFCKALA